MSKLLIIFLSAFLPFYALGMKNKSTATRLRSLKRSTKSPILGMVVGEGNEPYNYPTLVPSTQKSDFTKSISKKINMPHVKSQ